jgi:arylsulfatase
MQFDSVKSGQYTITRRSFMGATAAATATSLYSAEQKKPNIVFILCDDLGYGDLGCYGSSIRTPNLDRLAADGIRFANFDSADPVCSPSRAALLTGRYPTRVGVPRVLMPQDTGGLDPGETTLANVARDQGYRTACFGKWHLGRPDRYLPTNRGFDRYFGIPYSNDMNPRPLLEGTKVVEQTATLETLTRRYTEHAVQFIHESSRSPFFLYLPHTFPHIPLAASERFRGKSSQGLYGDVVEELDWSVGEVLQELKRNAEDNDTLVLFSSDNGPWYQGSPGRLRGRKATTYEGGVREPFIARWPGKIPAGQVSEAVTSMLDVFPTVTRLIGGRLPSKPLDGIDIWPILSGARKSIDREALLYFDNWDLQCARWNNWKLHVARHNSSTYSAEPAGGRRNFILPRPELYNLALDPAESYDVAPGHPEIVAEIQRRIDKLLAGFPEPVKQAWAESKARRVDPATPVGARPRPADGR